MSEWKECKLGELIDVKHGFAFKGEFFQTEPNGNILVSSPN
jgi:type I restriction enzyme S subunit